METGKYVLLCQQNTALSSSAITIVRPNDSMD